MQQDGSTRKRAPRRPSFLRPCDFCGDLYRAYHSILRIGKGRYCSQSCGVKAQHAREYAARPPLSVWFWEHINQTADLFSCWEWLGAHTMAGYGSLSAATGQGERYAHRLAWILTNGVIPDGLRVLHHCDNPPCCRPDHLFLGTPHDNSMDMAKKFRAGGTKLTGAQVREIRTRYAAGGIAQHKLAKEYGIAQVTVGRIIRKEVYVHVDDHDAALPT